MQIWIYTKLAILQKKIRKNLRLEKYQIFCKGS